jgi:hypothetical protein
MVIKANKEYIILIFSHSMHNDLSSLKHERQLTNPANSYPNQIHTTSHAIANLNSELSENNKYKVKVDRINE